MRAKHHISKKEAIGREEGKVTEGNILVNERERGKAEKWRGIDKGKVWMIITARHWTTKTRGIGRKGNEE